MTRRECENLVLSIVVALCVVPVVYSLSFCVNQVFSLVLTIRDSISTPLWLLIPFVLGGIVVGVITWHVAPESEGPGLHIVIAAFSKRHGQLRLRTGLSKYVTTLITLGSGTPNGIVSPAVMLGNSLVSYLNEVIQMDDDRQKTLSLCGMAAAIATLLQTPFGAALFAVEVVYGNYILYKRFFYCLSSSITAYTLVHLLNIQPPYTGVFPVPSITGKVLAAVVMTALMAVLVNISYIYVYQRIHDFSLEQSWRGKDWLKPAVGMALAALVVAPFYPLLMDFNLVGGQHYSLAVLQAAPLSQVFTVIVVIIVATSLVAGTGGSGGLFMPVMVLGILIGIVGASLTASPYLLVFMAAGISAALCTTLNVPLASAILCIELYGPSAILPAIIGSLTGYLLAKRYVIYHEIQWEELKEE
jgi:CIC family chloride channel protein